MALRVRDLMHPAEHVPGGVSVAAAARLMDRKHSDSLLVDHGNILGIVTERDILRKVVAKGLDPAHLTVAEVMSYPLHTVGPDSDIEAASELMDRHTIRRAVVVENGEIAGIITAASIARNVRYLTASRLISGGLGIEAVH